MSKLDKALDALKAQKYGAHTAAAIAEASVTQRQRWLKHGDKFLFVDPNSFLVTEVAAGVVPQGALRDITEAVKMDSQGATPDAVIAAESTETETTVAEGAEAAVAEGEPVAAAMEEVVVEAVTTSEMPAALVADDETEDAKKKNEKGDAAKDAKSDEDAPKEATRTLYLSELTALSEAVVDGEKKTVEVTLIKPGWSANGKFYGADVLRRDMAVFEGVKAYADHPSKSEETNRPERSVRDITGYYTNVRQADDGSLKATRHFVGTIGTGTIYPLVVEAISNKPDLMGLSINALGKTKLGEAEGRKGVIVEALVKGNSVDDVTTPAAGGKYDRLLMAASDEFTTDLLQAMEYEEWRESRPDFVARMKGEMRTARKEELTEAALQEAVTLREQLAAKDTTVRQLEEAKAQADKDLSDLRAANARRENEIVVERKLKESKLPAAWVADIKPQLQGKTEAEMDGVIEAKRKLYFASNQPVPVKESGGEAITSATTITREAATVSTVLGVNPNTRVREGESPEQWAARVGKL